jgi:hypothetical protein
MTSLTDVPVLYTIIDLAHTFPKFYRFDSFSVFELI